MPGISGLEIIRKMRSSVKNIPILVLSARHSVEDRVKGLESGADDYLVKPFSFLELLARVQALIRRSKGQAEPTALKVEDISLNLLTSLLTVIVMIEPLKLLRALPMDLINFVL